MSNKDEKKGGDGDDQTHRREVDLATLANELEEQGYGGLGTSGQGIGNTMQDIERRMGDLHLRPELDSGIAKLAEQAMGVTADLGNTVERILGPFPDLEERMNTLASVAGEDSAIGRVSKQIADQQRAIDALQSPGPWDVLGQSILEGVHDTPKFDFNGLEIPFRIPEITFPQVPQNPAVETNERLERIEARFERMQHIAADAARIATGLQAAAAEFLQKFERAAANNDRSAGRAIWIGVVAVFIAVAMPSAQIFYSEYRSAPNNAPEIQAALEEVQVQLRAMQEVQAAASERLGEALASSDDDTVTILRDIHSLLSQGAATSPPPSEQPGE